MEADPPSVEVSSLGLPAGTSCTTLGTTCGTTRGATLSTSFSTTLMAWQLHTSVPGMGGFLVGVPNPLALGSEAGNPQKW